MTAKPGEHPAAYPDFSVTVDRRETTSSAASRTTGAGTSNSAFCSCPARTGWDGCAVWQSAGGAGLAA